MDKDGSNLSAYENSCKILQKSLSCIFLKKSAIKFITGDLSKSFIFIL